MKKKIMIALLSLAAASVAQAGTVWSVNNHEYEVVSGTWLSWSAARSAAQALGPGWDLATIGSADENNFIIGLLGSQPSSVYRTWWLGGFENPQTQTWSWIDSTPWSYTAWYTGEPNNYGGNEDYLELVWHGPSSLFGWNDIRLDGWPDWTYGFIAEKIPSQNGGGSIPEPASLALMAMGLLGLAGLRRKS